MSKPKAAQKALHLWMPPIAYTTTQQARQRWYGEIGPLIEASHALGYWAPGASRKVRAALNKLLGAHKIAHDLKRQHSLSSGGTIVYYSAESAACQALHTGSPYLARAKSRLAVPGAKPLPKDKSKLLEAKESAERVNFWPRVDAYSATVTPLYDAMLVWDVTRPKPRFEFKLGQLSPTAHKTLADSHDVPLDGTTSRMPEIKWRKVKLPEPDKNGYVWKWVGTVIWPKGTKHGTSRFSNAKSRSKGFAEQCELCGHAIKNPFNWVLVLIDDAKGVPHSMWIGRDCAKRVFGYKGEPMELTNSPVGKAGKSRKP